MSDNWITIIPQDARALPSMAQRQRTLKRYMEMVPGAEEVELKSTRYFDFYDCGVNFDKVSCPTCKRKLSMDWWSKCLETDARAKGYKLAEYELPCCGAKHDLSELIYYRPQGFAKFALDAMNPDTIRLKKKYKEELEEILGIPLLVIYQHI